MYGKISSLLLSADDNPVKDKRYEVFRFTSPTPAYISVTRVFRLTAPLKGRFSSLRHVYLK
jgi:hypothetical protein